MEFVTVFNFLKPLEKEKLSENIEIKKYNVYEKICQQGETAKEFIYVLSGEAQSTMQLTDSILSGNVLKQYCFYGDIPLFEDIPYSETLICSKKMLVISVGKSYFLE